ncbi:HU family DNA-binding protein [Parabacteroides sp.]
MNKSELVEVLAGRMNIQQYKVRDFINNLQEVIGEELSKEEGGLVLQGFGTFTLWKQTARRGRNPRTGLECPIHARNSVKFKPGKFLLEALNDVKD